MYDNHLAKINKKLYQIIIDAEMTEDVMLKTVGKNIKNVRVEKKILQQDLAAICNIETPNMSRIENGRTNMTLKTLFKISEALGVEMYKLLLCDNSGGKKNGDKLKKP